MVIFTGNLRKGLTMKNIRERLYESFLISGPLCVQLFFSLRLILVGLLVTVFHASFHQLTYLHSENGYFDFIFFIGVAKAMLGVFGLIALLINSFKWNLIFSLGNLFYLAVITLNALSQSPTDIVWPNYTILSCLSAWLVFRTIYDNKKAE
jgi:hypothetical protein